MTAEALETAKAAGVSDARSRVNEHLKDGKDGRQAMAATLADAACDAGDALKLAASFPAELQQAVGQAVTILSMVAAAVDETTAKAIVMERAGAAAGGPEAAQPPSTPSSGDVNDAT